MNTLPLIQNNFLHKHIISLHQFDRQSIETLFDATDMIKKRLKNKEKLDLLDRYLVTLFFFEPSTRTFSSFAAATKRLGGKTIEYRNAFDTSSVIKGETIKDTIHMIQSYSDLAVIRHFEAGMVEKAASFARIPIVNAGDGSGEHPTQALLDLYTIKNHRGSLDGLKILISGDLLYGRTVHSLLKGLSYFSDIEVVLLSPPELAFPQDQLDVFQEKGHRYTILSSEKDIPQDCDIWYWTRVQKERFSSQQEYEKVKNKYIITKKLLAEKGNDELAIMHPLPRVGEISEDIDSDPRALYLTTQPKNGLFIRMALLALVMGEM